MAKQTKIDPAGLFQEMQKESDRAAAVLGPALLDHLLEVMFKVRLRQDTKPEVFEFRGPLGDFAGKIEMALALDWIDGATRDDLNVIRKIRNDFAHDVDHTLRFSDSSCRDRLRQMHVHKHIEASIQQLSSRYSLPLSGKQALEQTLTNVRTPRSQFDLAILVLGGPLAECIQEGRRSSYGTKSVLAFVAKVVDEALAPLREALASIATQG